MRIGAVVATLLLLATLQGDPVRTPSTIYNVVTVFRDGVGYDLARLRRAAAGLVGLN